VCDRPRNRDPTDANRRALRELLTPQSIRWQYTHGVPDTSRVAFDSSDLDSYYMTRPGADEAQLDLFLDYASNVALYPDFQAYFREHRPPFLAVWGRNDPFFLPAGAEAYKRDLPDAEIQFLDTGHFTLETHANEIAEAIGEFLARQRHEEQDEKRSHPWVQGLQRSDHVMTPQVRALSGRMSAGSEADIQLGEQNVL
jgi:pimeloyl-ACP methyl ester carboxylesterase